MKRTSVRTIKDAARLDRKLSTTQLRVRVFLTFAFFGAAGICAVIGEKRIGFVCMSYGIGFAFITALRLAMSETKERE
jgi:ribosomal protein S12 methylthiotransferase accessory factor YcaO